MSSTLAETNSKMRVPLIDLSGQHRVLRDELRQAIHKVLDSQQFVLGPEVDSLEAGIAEYCGTRYAVGCASGSDALLLALMALDVKAGDEVITTPFTFFATGAAIARLGAKPVFVDIDSRTYNLDVERVENAITSRTRAIIPVHLYGQCADMDALSEISNRRRIFIVEDAAQAIGAEYKRRRAGSMGLVGCFSFYPTKNLGGAGDGGMITTDDEDVAKRLRTLRVHGGRTEYEHDELGINSRLDSIQAAVLGVKLKYLDQWSDERGKRAQRYTELINDAALSQRMTPPFIRIGLRHIFHQYVVRVRGQRDSFKERLAANGVTTKTYYPVPLHLQKCFAPLGYREGDFPEAESAAAETLALPLFPELTDEQINYVMDVCRKFFDGV